jgi:hypothetical protein
MTAALGLAVPAWPVVVLAWSASTTPVLSVALAEGALLAASAALPWAGQQLRHFLRQADVAQVAATGLGLALAAGLWVARGVWLLLPG